MTPPPESLSRQLPRIAVIGAIVGVAAVLMFIVLWMILEGQPQATRLFVSLCLPPGVLALLIGAYIFVARPKL